MPPHQQVQHARNIMLILLLLANSGCEAWSILIFEPDIPPYQEPSVEPIPIDIVVRTPSSDQLSEDGEVLEFRVSLSAQPPEQVTIPVIVSDETQARANVSMFIFNSSDWNVPKRVELIGLDDKVKDGQSPFFLHLGAGTSNAKQIVGLKQVSIPLFSKDGVCGNTVLDGEEDCEPTLASSCDYGEVTCPSTCNEDCSFGPSKTARFCGDSIVQAMEGEECDGEEQFECENGYGVETCTNECQRDRAQCIEIIDIFAGGDHSCFLDSNQTAWCWGNNIQGQLGRGTRGGTLQDEEEWRPQRVKGLGPTQQLLAGNNHTCALLQNETIACWGVNTFGELGDGLNMDSLEPTNTLNIQGALSLGGGNAHTCTSIKPQGEVYCWGNNFENQTSSASELAVRTPTKTFNAANPKQLVGGLSHTCALEGSSGRVRCWGGNLNGQLGDGTVRASLEDVFVVGMNDAQSIAAGSLFTCASLFNGTVQCWGENVSRPVEQWTTPQTIEGLTDIVQIVAGFKHVCASNSRGDVWCWGQNSRGELGVGDFNPHDTPIQVNLAAPSDTLSAGESHTCALLKTGQVQCWGYNNQGQLGNNSQESSASPVFLSNFETNP